MSPYRANCSTRVANLPDVERTISLSLPDSHGLRASLVRCLHHAVPGSATSLSLPPEHPQ